MGIGHVDMAEIRRQNWQQSLRILLGLVPTHQGVRCEHVPHVMQSRAMAFVQAAQTDLARQSIEGSMDVPEIKAITQLGREQIRRCRLSRAILLTAFDIIPENGAR